MKDKTKIKEPLEIITTIGNWVFGLERLKNGRWTRFGAAESDLIKISLLQTKMCDHVLLLYKGLVQAIGTTKDVKSIEHEIDQLTVLSKELNEDLKKYIKLYGIQSISQN